MSPRTFVTQLVALCMALTAAGAQAGNATADEATAMVKKGVAFIKAQGTEKG
jgi:cytochrome c